jgi:Dockerin type I domain
MRRAALIALLLALGCAERAAGAGPTFVVNQTSEGSDVAPGNGICETAPGNGKCTLEAAIQEANATTDALILLPPTAPGDPILLDGDAFSLDKPVTILGAGRNATTVSGKTTSTVFLIPNTTSGAVTVKALSIVDANDGSPLRGGGIRNEGCGVTLSVEDVLIANCTGANAGGIFSRGPLSMARCEIRSCHGVIGFDPGAPGAIGLRSCAVTHVVRDSTLDGNTAGDEGGALYLAAGELHLVNTTVSGNSAPKGGGIYVAGGQLYLENATVAGNSAGTVAGGGGLYNASALSAANFVNTILASNHQSGGQFAVEGNCTGLLTSQGHNVYGVDDQADCSIQGGGVTFGDPLLAPLQDNGGPTPTRALYTGSPAIDTGDPAGCMSQLVTLTADQRGVKRPIGTACDIGAYERSLCGDANGDGAVDIADVFFLINFLFASGPLPPGLSNVNGDSSIDIADVFFLINRLFAGGPAPNCPGT